MAMKQAVQQKQVNIRLDDTTLARIDRCRIALTEKLGKIPTRSGVVRMALENYLKRCD